MGAQGRISPWAIVILVIVVLFLWAVSLPNYIKVKDKAVGARNMTLSSGVDKKSSRGDMMDGEGWAMADAAPASPGSMAYETQSRGSANSAGSPGHNPTPDASPADDSGGSVVGNALQAAGIDEGLFDSWLLPAAYAADHEVDERYLVRTGNCQIDVESYKDAVKTIELTAQKFGGMVSDSRSQRHGDNWIEGYITLRVPSDKFFDVWREVLQVGTVNEESTSSQDVSQQYVGYVSELKNLMAMQATLQKMLDEALAVQRARGLGEGYSILLDTQDRLFEITGRIEGTEDRLNALSDQITRSTITVSLVEKRELPQQVQQVTDEFSWGLGTTAAAAYRDLLVRVRNALQGLTYFIITCWTWLIPWALIIWLGTWIYKKYVKPRLALAPAPVIRTEVKADTDDDEK